VSASGAHPSRRSLRALDALTFLQVGLGPFLAIYLQSVRNWTPARIGMVLATAGLAGMLAQVPVGALIDRLRHKRELYAVGAVIAAAGRLATVGLSSFPEMIAVQVLLGVASAIFAPAIAAISLGMVGWDALDRRIGRNETLNHAGSALLAALMGLAGYALAPQSMFCVAAMLWLVAAFCAGCIRGQDINDDWARGSNGARPGVDSHSSGDASRLAAVMAGPRLIVFALSVLLFHLANAAMLPLAGQRLSLGHGKSAPLCMAVCIIGAQLLMALVAGPASRLAGYWGRKPVFLVALCLLPLRGLLFALDPSPLMVISVQLLDGISAAIFGVVNVLIVAHLTQGTGHFNFTQGLIATATGTGATLSALLGEFVAQKAGFGATFLALAVVGIAALLLFALAMPETLLARTVCPGRPARRCGDPASGIVN
jgi:MFS family permease